MAGNAEVGGVRHGRKEEADAKVPACLINRAQYRIAGTNFPDAPLIQCDYDVPAGTGLT